MMDVMEWISLLVALVSGAAAGGVTVGVMRGRLHSIEERLTSLEKRVIDAHHRMDRLHNGHS